MQDDDARNEAIYRAYTDDIREYGQPSWERISDALPDVDLSVRQMRRIAREMYKERGDEVGTSPLNDDDETPPETSAQFRVSKDGFSAEAASVGSVVSSLEGLLQACGYYENGHDKLWKVKHHIVNAYSMGRKHKIVDIRWTDGRADGHVYDTGGWNKLQNWQVKAWFEPRKEYPLDAAIDDIVTTLSDRAISYSLPKTHTPNGEYLFVPSLYDAHVNKRSIDGEYTLERAVNVYKSAGDTMIARALSLNMPIKRILFVVGQDALHVDNLIGTTTAGTWVEMASGQRRAINAVCDAVTYTIEQLAKIAPVDVVTVESNHDRYSVYWLGKVIAAWFRNHPAVAVDELYTDGTARPRKYYKFGNNLLGLDHGKDVKPADLALTMAVESPEDWAKTEYREFLRGHFHRRVNMYHQVIEEKGVNVRVLPALCPPDEWHVMRGFIGSKRAADALFYHYDHGPAGTFPVFVDELIDLY